MRIAAVLRLHEGAGVSATRLVEVAGFEGEGASDQLAREIRNLNRQGWQIDNVAGQGEVAHYRMATVDNRLRVRLTPEQQRALRRAVLLARRGDLVDRLGLPASAAPADVEASVPLSAHDETLSLVMRAVRRRSVLRFGYKGSARVVHPESVRTQNGTWYFRGVEETAGGAPVTDLAVPQLSGSDLSGPAPSGPAPSGPDHHGHVVKTFVVARMKDVEADPPGSAVRVTPAEHVGLHPMSWTIDPLVDVVLATTADYRPDVVRWLGSPAGEQVEGDQVMMRYRVTNRAALRARLYELGRRVRLVGPDDVRQELVDELRAIAGHA